MLQIPLGQPEVVLILKLGESGEVWGDLHSDSVGSSDFQFFEGSQPLGGKFLAEVIVLCAGQNKISNLQLC